MADSSQVYIAGQTPAYSVVDGPIFIGTFDPATMPLTGWYREYPGTLPWSPTASAGTSGSNGNLVTNVGNDPTAGTPVNGHASALFTAASSQMAEGFNAGTTFFGSGATGSMAVLCKPNAGMPAPTGFWATDTGIFISYVAAGVAVNSAGFIVGGYNPTDGYVQTAQMNATVNGSTWHLVQLTWDGTNLYGRVDGGAQISTPCPGGVYVAELAVEPWAGTNYFLGNFYDGEILDIIMSDQLFSLTDLNNLRLYVYARYGIAV